MELDWAVHVRSCPGAPRGGDVGVVRLHEGGAVVALVDATGHGLTAYAVAQVARRILLETASKDPAEILGQLDAALAGGIGAAASVARIEGRTLQFAGIGNVAASVGLRPLLVRAGVLGHRMRTPQVVQVPFEPDTWLLMHTDGLSRPQAIPAGSADTAARALVAANAADHDDAGVVLVRWRERLP